ncbi:MAG TPA: class I SAM-dependent methyltransferase, partial [Steroidobacteraceae bacterium]
FAAPELHSAIASLNLVPAMRVIDAGCGTGETLAQLCEAVSPDGWVVGFDLAAAHTKATHAHLRPRSAVLQADLMRPPLVPASFDLVWSVNTINHLRDPLQGLLELAKLLRPGGRVALSQSSFVPDMYFAWDARLERVTNEAVRRYYRERYGLDERALTEIRALVGLLRRGKFKNVSARTFMIERISPLASADEAYFLEAIFRGTWGERLRPYLTGEDFAHLTCLCDPLDSRFAPRRADFHFLQSLTLVVAEVA